MNIIKDFFKEASNIKDQTKKIKNKKITISTGSFFIDKLTGTNGLNLGTIVEIVGDASSGKTTLCLQIAKNALKKLKNKFVLYIDTESCLDIDSIMKQHKILVNQEKFFLESIYQTGTKLLSAEKIFENIRQILNTKNHNLGVIIIDSVAALLTESDINGKITDEKVIATLARILSRSLPIIKKLCARENVLLILVNQYRTKLNTSGFSYGRTTKTSPGGKSIKYYIDLKLDLIRISSIKENKDKDEKIVGSNVHITATKNKLGGIFGQFTIAPLIVNKGFDPYREITLDAINKKIIIRKGSWFYFKDKSLGQGINKIIEKLNENFFLKDYPEYKPYIKIQENNKLSKKKNNEKNKKFNK